MSRNPPSDPRPGSPARPAARPRLGLEQLEDRLAPSATAQEQYLLELINRMRTDPADELAILQANPEVQQALAYFGVNEQTLAQQWATLTPAAPLAWNDDLASSAAAHDQAMLSAGQQAHQVAGEADLATRAAAAGYVGAVGENVYAYATDEFYAHAGFAIDWGNGPGGIQNPAGHRDNIMDPRYADVGIALLDAPSGSAVGPLLVTEDFGIPGMSNNPFLLGVVYSDSDHDGYYSVGEGRGAVTVTITGTGGSYQTTTADAGGYQIRVAPGTYTVTFSGGGLTTPLTQTVTVGSSNVKADVRLNVTSTDPIVAVGDQTGDSIVRVIDTVTGAIKAQFEAYPGFKGGVHVAVADVTGDGVPDIITGAGAGGGPHVKVFDGVNFAEVRSFFAYSSSFSGGVNVAASDFNGDGFADIVTGAGPGGGPHVKVFSGKDGSTLQSFFAYDASFSGGVSVAAGDTNGDGVPDIITGAGRGGSPHVRVFDGQSLALLQNFYAYDSGFSGGVFVAAGDVDGDGRADIITGAGSGGGPHVKVFDGETLAVKQSFFAYDAGFSGGVVVAARDADGDGRTDVVTGGGPGAAEPVRLFFGKGGQKDLAAAGADSAGGTTVG